MPGSKDFSVWFHRRNANSGAVRVIEKRLWTGQGIGFPRSQLSQVRDRYSNIRSGVYVLWGYGGNHVSPRVYIGESDETFKRLGNHDRADDKGYWEQSVVFTSKDQGLNKAHVQYIEARLVQLAQEGNRVQLMNSTTPRTAPLSETDRAVAESFIGDLLDCLAVLGVDFFEPPDRATPDTEIQIERLEASTDPTAETKIDEISSNAAHSPIIDEDITTGTESVAGTEEVLSIRSKGIVAHGYESQGKFVVKAGSQAAKTLTDSARTRLNLKHIPAWRDKLINGYKDDKENFIEPALEEKGPHYEFVRDFTFNSPSAASCQILGASSNGNDVWKDENERTLGEIRKS